jgi:hypothetical protein
MAILGSTEAQIYRLAAPARFARAKEDVEKICNQMLAKASAWRGGSW